MDTTLTILNYTGKRIGLTNESGNPIQVLPVNGNARVEVSVKKSRQAGRVAIYEKSFSKARGLPAADPNLAKLYIVNEDVARAEGNSRFDLLVAEDPIKEGGILYYRKLVNY